MNELFSKNLSKLTNLQRQILREYVLGASDTDICDKFNVFESDLQKQKEQITSIYNKTFHELLDTIRDHRPLVLEILDRLNTIPPELLNIDESIPLEVFNKYTWTTQKKSISILSKRFVWLRGIRDLSFTKLRQLREAKMVFVGDGGVGKTSLLRRLLYGSFIPEHEVTEGINIQTWTFMHSNQSYKINIWDFGGQELMQATHPFFMTHRTLYILVLNSSLNDEDNHVKDWLSIIQSFGGNSPIVIVRNQVDRVQPSTEHILMNEHILRAYSQIQAVYHTSCKTTEGLDSLWRGVKEVLLKLPHIHNRIPEEWYKIKEQVEAQQITYTSYGRFREWCNEEGVIELTDQQRLVAFLHDLGTILCYQDDVRVKNTPVLNPSWIADGIYTILHAQSHVQNGILHIADISKILNPRHYPDDMHLFLIEIMKKFHTCMDVPDLPNTVLLPSLLPDHQPPHHLWQDVWPEALRFIYQYKVIPGNLFVHVLTRLHALLDRTTLYRSGGIVHTGNNHVYGRLWLDRNAKQIHIEVWTDTDYLTREQRELLGYIRTTMEIVHRSFAALKATLMVPLSNTTHLASYEHLCKLFAEGQQYYSIPGEERKVHIPQILDRIDETQDRVSTEHESIQHLEERLAVFEATMKANVDARFQAFETAHTKIPFVAAFGTATTGENDRLALDQDQQGLHDVLAEHHTRLHLHVLPAATIDNLCTALLRYRPQILYLAGHGQSWGIALHGTGDKSQMIPRTALFEELSSHTAYLQCVIINTCYSGSRLPPLDDYDIPYVITMKTAIYDRVARTWAAAFFERIGFGHAIPAAFQAAVTRIKLYNFPGDTTPRLWQKDSDDC